jgi:ubiquinone/menaquinone biosynthesis C-methylase UbiE
MFGSIAKYSGLMPAERFKRMEPHPIEGDPSYDSVAALYDAAYADIRVRTEEWEWLRQRIPTTGLRVLDIGCGSGALLLQLANHLAQGTGVDISRPLLEIARSRAKGLRQLEFLHINGPCLTLADRSIDLIVSLHSFRYLDWDPMMNELRRVLAPGGRMLIIDEVTTPLLLSDVPRAIRSRLRQVIRMRRFPESLRAQRVLTRDPRWANMLKYNPVRLERELRLYLESRFPSGKLDVLSIDGSYRTLAFDTGPLEPGWVAPQSYP